MRLPKTKIEMEENEKPAAAIAGCPLLELVEIRYHREESHSMTTTLVEENLLKGPVVKTWGHLLSVMVAESHRDRNQKTVALAVMTTVEGMMKTTNPTNPAVEQWV